MPPGCSCRSTGWAVRERFSCTVFGDQSPLGKHSDKLRTQGGFMSVSLEGKIALVTGGSRGIGRAIAERLAADGPAVVINYARNERRAQEVVKGILTKGVKAVAIQADVSKPAEVRRLFDEAEKEVGRLDIVVGNAGVVREKPL